VKTSIFTMTNVAWFW